LLITLIVSNNMCVAVDELKSLKLPPVSNVLSKYF